MGYWYIGLGDIYESHDVSYAPHVQIVWMITVIEWQEMTQYFWL